MIDTEFSPHHWVIGYVREPVVCCPQSSAEMFLQVLVLLRACTDIINRWVWNVLQKVENLGLELCISESFYAVKSQLNVKLLMSWSYRSVTFNIGPWISSANARKNWVKWSTQKTRKKTHCDDLLFRLNDRNHRLLNWEVSSLSVF